MSASDPAQARAFAVDIVHRLRAAGHQALWAGGCVRDELLGLTPKDYDVATSATPDETRALFGPRRTLAIGAAFGVIAVVGRRDQGTVEVTTFRRDVDYHDGRHPDHVEFSTAAEDAQRRDFTINGLFFDPLSEQIVDYVDGQADLRAGIVRAIGEPRQRFTEDKLRMLRAVRMAGTFDFAFDPATLATIQTMAPEVTVVSAERIAQEMRRMLELPRLPRVVDCLRDSGLLAVVLPEAMGRSDDAWQATHGLLGSLSIYRFPLSLAAILLEGGDPRQTSELATAIGQRWRLANRETERLGWLLNHAQSLAGARTKRWSEVQPLLVADGAAELVELHAARARATGSAPDDVEFCRARMAWPAAQLNPPPLVTGDDLRGAGLRPGPQFAVMLGQVRAAQLDGQLADRAAALEFVRTLKP